MRRTRTVAIPVLVLTSIVLACSGAHVGEADDVARQEPPMGLIERNFERAPFVWAIELESVVMVDTLKADDGRIGYASFEVFAKVVETYKGGWPPARHIRYRFTVEYDPDWQDHWRPGDRVLVFLAEFTGHLWYVLIDEAAQFHMSPALRKEMQHLVEAQ